MLGRLTRLETLLTETIGGLDHSNANDEKVLANLKRLDEAKALVKDMRADASLDVLRGFEVFGPIKTGEIHPTQYVFLALTEYDIKKLMASADAKYIPDLIRLCNRAIRHIIEAPEYPDTHLPKDFGSWLVKEYIGSGNPEIIKACLELQKSLDDASET